MLSVTKFSIFGSYSFLKIFITYSRGIIFESLLAPITFSSIYSILSLLKKWGSIDRFLVLKKKIVSPWDFFAYMWAIPYESETGSCWNFTLREGFHFAGFHLFLIKKVHNIIITLKAHASQTLHCNQWFFYLLDYSSNFEVSFFPWIIFLWVSPEKNYLN